MRPTPGRSVNRRIIQKITEIDPDILILTETHGCIDIPGAYSIVWTDPSPRKNRLGESVAAIWSKYPLVQRLPTFDSRETVCVQVQAPVGSLVVYGSIIPYHGYKPADATWPPGRYESINRHRQDWEILRSKHPGCEMIVGGDYNQTRDGSKSYGSDRARDALGTALRACSLTCVTEEDFVATGKLRDRHSIDHVALSQRLLPTLRFVGVWEAFDEFGSLSDHNGVFVDLTI
jgi:hypothetical protein